jgi:hypothetical protein
MVRQACKQVHAMHRGGLFMAERLDMMNRNIYFFGLIFIWYFFIRYRQYNDAGSSIRNVFLLLEKIQKYYL